MRFIAQSRTLCCIDARRPKKKSRDNERERRDTEEDGERARERAT